MTKVQLRFRLLRPLDEHRCSALLTLTLSMVYSTCKSLVRKKLMWSMMRHA